MIHRVVSITDGSPTFEKPLSDILSTLKPGGAIQTLDPNEYVTSRQRRWYKGICLKGLSDWSGDTPSEWDMRVKAVCADGLLKTEKIYINSVNTFNRLTTKGVGKRNMTQFIEQILSKAIEMDWPVVSPDSELRKESR